MSSVEALPKDSGTKISEPRWGRHDTARQFLPAALEILETPASPAGRAIGATIVLFFVLAVAWAVFGRVDIIATALRLPFVFDFDPLFKSGSHPFANFYFCVA